MADVRGVGATLVLMVVCRGTAADVHEPPLGLRTLDITPQSWSELKPEYRLKGRVGDTLAFAEIEDVYVLRCLMHVLNKAHIEKTVEWAIAPGAEFFSRPVPERLLRVKEPALLTVKGVVGLMNIYSGMTIVEMNGLWGGVESGAMTSGLEAPELSEFFGTRLVPFSGRALRKGCFVV